jgi:DNA-binding FadR family transcriptional regulator
MEDPANSEFEEVFAGTAVDPRMHQRFALHLAREIVGGRTPEGSVVPSSDTFVKGHGVSRTVARETIQALATAGLVRVQHGKRTVVTGMRQWKFLEGLVQRALSHERFAPQLVGQLYEVRIPLEVQSARLCAQRADAAVFERISRLADVSPLRKGSWTSEDFVAYDTAFHAAIADGGQNVVLSQLVTDMHRGLVANRTLAPLEPRELIVIGRQHAAIAARLSERDGDAAADAMRVHLEWTSKRHAGTER